VEGRCKSVRAKTEKATGIIDCEKDRSPQKCPPKSMEKQDFLIKNAPFWAKKRAKTAVCDY
jgi:hypothetical protein